MEKFKIKTSMSQLMGSIDYEWIILIAFAIDFFLLACC